MVLEGAAFVSDLSAGRPGHLSTSIADLVFAGKTGGGGRRLALGAVTVLACYVGLFVAVSRLGRSAGPWSAEMAARIHEAVAAEMAVDMTAPPPPPPAVTSSEPKAESPRLARVAPASHARPAAPAQAGQLAAASLEPADFTGTAFVVGGSSYAGGTTNSHGTSKTPARGIGAPGGTGDGAGARSQARPVSRDQEAWSCRWPAEADAQQVNEQTVVLRATVRADGRAERVEVLANPGYGFGGAARLCALATRFEPARDPAGQPVTSLSPPIRVHFFR